MAHPHSGSNFLSHDPTPVDPRTITYEPSTGPRTRRPGYVNKHLVMSDQPTRPIRGGAQSEEPQRHQRVRKMQNVPGQSSKASDFFAGMHSTSSDVVQSPARRKPLPEKADLSRARQQQQEIHDFIQADQQAKAQRRQQQRQEKEMELKAAASFDPWTKPGAHIPASDNRRHNVLKQAHQAGDDTSFLSGIGTTPQQVTPSRTHSGRQREKETKMANLLRFNIGAQALPKFRDKPTQAAPEVRAPRQDILIPRRVVDRESRVELSHALQSQMQQKSQRDSSQRDYDRSWAPARQAPSAAGKGGSYADIARRRKESASRAPSSRVASSVAH
eukprot:m.386629 g.386629  ORF g.386629 m.386629 type:complete len:330 (-) comp20055_c2_seq1:223-1212(-)